MPAQPYLTAPVPSTSLPRGVPYIIGNEAAERFSFYGMRGILVAFMTKYLLDASGALAPMSPEEAKRYFHLFVMSAYFFPLFGAIISDIWLGKYRTIISLSLVYCLGHLALAVDETRMGLFLGLFLIALGSGGIKPCVSAHVGDQFGKSNVHLQSKIFGWFYLSINLGSAISTLVTPPLLETVPGWLQKNYPSLAAPATLERLGPHLAFGLPGLLMLLATWVFWLGRHKFVHIPARGWNAVFASVKGEGGLAILRLLPIFAFIAVFWSLYDQSGSAWVLQADEMDRRMLGVNWLSSEIQTINPILILVFIPLFSYVVYPALNRVFPLTPLRKMGIGFFLTVLSFAISGWAQLLIDQKQTPSAYWQIAAYVVMTAAEVMVWVTGLEFCYTQAPREVKSFIMALGLLSVSAGNAFTALVNWFIEKPGGGSKLAGADYYWFFSGLMAVAAVLFVFVARTYVEKTYIQEEQPANA